jgi:CRP-like cAMP-binding protein
MVQSPGRRVSANLRRFPKKSNSVISAFDVRLFLDSAGVGRTVESFQASQTVFTQGDPAKNLMYIQEGRVKLTVVNETGKEAVVSILAPGDFFGEGCLTDHSLQTLTATATAPTTVLAIKKHEVIRVLHEERAFSDRFIANILKRNQRFQDDLIDQLFNSIEKRLARTLLLLAHYDEEGQPQQVLQKMTQETLAEMIGTTRTRVNMFMNKFRKLGFIEYNGEIKVNKSLLNVVLHE